MSEPGLSTFDVDMERDPRPSSQTATTMFGALKKIHKKQPDPQPAHPHLQPQLTQSASSTTTSSASDPDYLGLYKLYEDPSVETSTFSSRLGQAGSTTANVGVEASESSEMIEEE